MAGRSLTTASTLQCPHGGQVRISSSSSVVQAVGAAMVTTADTFTISGCPFQIPATPPVPSPCMRVQWVVPDVVTRVNGTATLSEGSTGLCLAATMVPQGPVVVAATQAAVEAR
jgi:hypothetical protein